MTELEKLKQEYEQANSEYMLINIDIEAHEKKRYRADELKRKYINEICRNAAGKFYRCDYSFGPEYYYIKSVLPPKKGRFWYRWNCHEISISFASTYVILSNKRGMELGARELVEITREEFENAQRFYEYFKEGEKRFKKDFREKMKELGLKTK
ncbi:MAG: hypothetical protein IJK62_00395 [Bacteroidales bacterium]|nr:hypothetical protein [Bacteroidales bacterium]MBQ6275153.1 hypothetical protein [Bacteroidales bacterium]